VPFSQTNDTSTTTQQGVDVMHQDYHALKAIQRTPGAPSHKLQRTTNLLFGDMAECVAGAKALDAPA
jgi:hypothetical protein